jgi:hypothetical protein
VLRWLRDIVRNGVDVVALRADVAEKRLRQLGPTIAMAMVLGWVGGAAACALLAGIVILLAPSIGLGLALALVGAVPASALAAAAWISVRRLARSAGASAAAARTAQARLSELLEAGASAPGAGAGAAGDPLQRAIGAAVANPALLASALFAALSVLGARRAIRIARAASALASVGAVVARMASPAGGVTRNGRAHGERQARGPCRDRVER